MAVHEIKKSCKIVSELLLYLMKNGHHQVTFKIDYDETITKFIFTVKECSSSVISHLAENLNKGRKYEFEGYYWELMGESDSANELEIIGLLVDGIEIVEVGENTILTITREHADLSK